MEDEMPCPGGGVAHTTVVLFVLNIESDDRSRDIDVAPVGVLDGGDDDDIRLP